jgi:hypothetical protein
MVYDFKQALARYRCNRFTDADVIRCTGFPKRSVRELIKVRAVRTLSDSRGGAGHMRTFDATTFKRLAIASALHDAGSSLTLAGQLAYQLPGERRLFAHYDPINVLCDTRVVNSQGELPPLLTTPLFDWFDADKPAAADPENDQLLEIYDGRFVALTSKQLSEPLIYGDLRAERTKFVSWWPFQSHTSAVFSTHADVAPKWEDPHVEANRIDPAFLNYHYEPHHYEPHHDETDPLMREARAAAQRPVFKTSINISLALRLALRRYLGLEPLLSRDVG